MTLLVYAPAGQPIRAALNSKHLQYITKAGVSLSTAIRTWTALQQGIRSQHGMADPGELVPSVADIYDMILCGLNNPTSPTTPTPLFHLLPAPDPDIGHAAERLCSFAGLDKKQSEVVALVANTECGVQLVQGPPGTGKTRTIAELVLQQVGKLKAQKEGVGEEECLYDVSMC